MRNSERGFSLMEITVVLAIVSVLMISIYSMIEQAVRTAMFNESHNDLAVLTQRAVNSLQTELIQTKMGSRASSRRCGSRTTTMATTGRPRSSSWPTVTSSSMSTSRRSRRRRLRAADARSICS
jgi:prepilin-type N-terminal cleavage/methylation domain-containing protein